MFLLILLSLFFCWLAINAMRGPTPLTGYDYGVAALFLSIALLCAMFPFNHWRFERFLERNAIIVSENPDVTLHCNSVIDSIFDNDLRIGHANFTTGAIVFQQSWCKKLKAYLADPENPTPDGLMSLHLFTHEAMHARGERNEQKTDCQAIQRDYQVATLLGVPDDLARQNSMTYYQTMYPRHSYFSRECAPGKGLDENLSDSTWNL